MKNIKLKQFLCCCESSHSVVREKKGQIIRENAQFQQFKWRKKKQKKKNEKKIHLSNIKMSIYWKLVDNSW